MELKEYIESAIAQISEGLHNAQERVKKDSTRILPYSYEDFPSETKIHFDIAVVSTGSGSGGKIEVKCFGIKVGGNTGSTSEESTSRIVFDIPVAFVIQNKGQNRPR